LPRLQANREEAPDPPPPQRVEVTIFGLAPTSDIASPEHPSGRLCGPYVDANLIDFNAAPEGREWP